MGWLEAAVVALAASAGALLLGDGRSAAERRLSALAPPSPPPRRPRRAAGRVPRVLLAGVPLAVSWPLLGTGAGVPVGLAVGALVWWRLGRTAPDGPHDRAGAATAVLPLVVDLLVSGLRSGAHPNDVVETVARATGGPIGAELDGVARRLRLGVDPTHAWRSVRGPEELGALGRAVARASRTGAPLADVLELHAADCRRAARARALALAQRTGVAVVIPLGLCFLPAFVLIGVVPLAAGLLSDLVLP
ncbi:type II secretion system F family protein [Thermobifida halotolerans]|uniref:Type II secretion system F family protein n=1 Tax=Thermobifida halotolerans TaxID=483545 RepID=A0A399FY52_9ACTN|nr:type II secretion system F family protein [Thermobifida halotolerans]UOE19192.1 type II secretion system F family protein [Thermobifida halotolerans]